MVTEYEQIKDMTFSDYISWLEVNHAGFAGG
jgi:hypothetical protein